MRTDEGHTAEADLNEGGRLPPAVIAIMEELAGQPSPMTQAVMRASEHFVQQRMMRLERRGREHLDVPPVYLGHCQDLCNVRDLLTTGQTKRQIVATFAAMTGAAYAFHPLHRFFEPHPNGVGYVPKKVRYPGGPAVMFEVDHIVPASWERGPAPHGGARPRGRRRGPSTELLRHAPEPQRQFPRRAAGEQNGLH